MKYRKKPVIVEATKWQRNGDHPKDDVMRPFEDTGKMPTEPREGAVVRYYRHPRVPGTDFCAYCKRMFHDHGWIDTLEGGHIVCPGDWIITGVKGEHYPCKPDIFAATYEQAEAHGSATHPYCKDCIHSCAMMQIPTYDPDAWCYMFRDGSHIEKTGTCGQKRLNPHVPSPSA